MAAVTLMDDYQQRAMRAKTPEVAAMARAGGDAGMKLASLLGIAMTRTLTGVEVDEALDLIAEIRRGA